MPSELKIKKEIDLDLKDVPRGRRAEVKREIGEFIIDEILNHLEQGKSPVKGEGKFKLLDTEYAKQEKGGRRTANLELEGDLKEAIFSKNTLDGLIIGVKNKEADKADGHNQLTEKAQAWAKSRKKPFPKRRFIPDENQTFNKNIMIGVNEIIKEYEELPLKRERVEEARETEERIETEITLEDIIQDKNILDEIEEILKGSV